MNIYNLNTEMVITEKPKNLYLCGTAKEVFHRLNRIDAMHEMLFSEHANDHIKWVIFCELSCLLKGE